jgi:two-component system sensor histidine kinase SenX3
VSAPDASAGADESDRLALVRAALELVPIGIVIEDSGGGTVLANGRATSPLGDITGDTLAAVAVKKALGEARRGIATVEAVDVAGTPPRRVEVLASPVPTGGAVAAVVDTSERLRLDNVRRDLVANVNHELRTPIGALAVLSETLAFEREPATVERLVGRIHIEATRAQRLIDDLLDFARVETDEQPAQEPVSIADVIDAAATRVAAPAGLRRVRLDVDVDGDPVVVGDRAQLVVAVENLLDNAIKYSAEESTVRVSARTTDGGTVVEIVVSDDGIGIPARDLDRIFERFYRVDQARDRRTGGSGLGLAIVRHVASNHRGEVRAASIEGEGSTFTLQLPAERPA